MIKCSDCQDLLSEYIDNDLRDSKNAEVLAHLQMCNGCNLLYVDLVRIVSVGKELPLLAPQNPLWENIEREIKLLTAKKSAGRPSLWERFWSYQIELRLSMPQLSAGAASLMLLLGLTATVSYRPDLIADRDLSAKTPSANSIIARPAPNVMNPEEAEIRGAIERLTKAIEQKRTKWDPKMQELFDRNYAIVNRSVAESREIALRNPNDEVSREILIIAYREKLRLLEQFASL